MVLCLTVPINALSHRTHHMERQIARDIFYRLYETHYSFKYIVNHHQHVTDRQWHCRCSINRVRVGETQKTEELLYLLHVCVYGISSPPGRKRKLTLAAVRAQRWPSSSCLHSSQSSVGLAMFIATSERWQQSPTAKGLRGQASIDLFTHRTARWVQVSQTQSSDSRSAILATAPCNAVHLKRLGCAVKALV